MKCCSGSSFLSVSVSPLYYGGKFVLEVFLVLVLLILAFQVDHSKTVELEHRARSAERVKRFVRSLGADLDGRLVEQRRVHLRGDEAFPDQRIDLQFVFAEFPLEGIRGASDRSGADGFMGVLGCFFRLVDVGGRRQIFSP